MYYTKSKNEIKPQLAMANADVKENYTKSKNEIKPQHASVEWVEENIIPNQRTKSNHN